MQAISDYFDSIRASDPYNTIWYEHVLSSSGATAETRHDANCRFLTPGLKRLRCRVGCPYEDDTQG